MHPLPTLAIPIVALTILTAVSASPAQAVAGCGSKHGEAYIRCVETGNNPKYAHDGAEHPGPSSASGAYGLLDGTRSDYDCRGVSDRTCATRYMRSRYGSWAAAAAAHRRKGFW